jgi:WS/DGAT/MGAT family acyltransferase
MTMKQLSGIDTSFLRVETRTVHGHVGGVMVLDPSTADGPFTVERLRAFIGERLHLLDQFRLIAVEVPFQLDHPYWVEVPEVDLEYHVRATALPSPGTDRQLADQCARIAARQLDRSRPLWEIYLIEGLADGRVGIQSKLHHAAFDGAATMKLLQLLLDMGPNPREIPPPDPDRVVPPQPGPEEMLTRGWMGLLRRPEELMRAQMRLLQAMTGAGEPDGDVLKRSVEMLNKATRAAPKTPFNRPITEHRAWSFGRLPLADVKRIKDAHGCTVNDVVMALCAGSLRRWLSDHDALPHVPLVALVPVSTRTGGDAQEMGNQVGGMIVELPTNLADPVGRLLAARDTMRPAKEQFKAVPAALMQDLAHFTGPAAAEFTARATSSLRPDSDVHVPFNVCISNVPAPRTPVYYAGAEVKTMYPLSMISHGMGMNITLHGYCDSLDFGILVSPELVPDVWSLIGYLRDELQELLAVMP